MADIEQNIAAYQAMRLDLEAHHKGKWAVFYQSKLVDVFDSFDTAASEAVARFHEGPYLIRQIGAHDMVMPASLMYRVG